jgi:Polyketide cyclase / dehydrase and lipid transport
MWHYEHSAETTAPADAIWRLWADVPGWPAWNGDIEQIELHGPFAAGSTISMTPVGGEPVELTLREVQPDAGFVDEAELDGVVVRTEHRLDAAGPGRLRVTYRTEITGERAGEIGPAITADFPDTVAALLARAGA